jgi:hypothetical protein
MGCMGSGSWSRHYASKGTVESRNSVSVHYLKKQGCLHEGNNGTLSWSRGDEPCGSIGYHVKANGIQFSYRSRASELAEWENVELFIQFDCTACNYGKQRTWLLCLQCDKRVAIVYSEGKYFHCRKCCQLNYRTQHENYFDRQQTKAENIRRKLGGDISMRSHFPDKPKGMHWQTYTQLYNKTMQCEIDSLEGRMLSLKRLNRMLDKLGQRWTKR